MHLVLIYLQYKAASFSDVLNKAMLFQQSAKWGEGWGLTGESHVTSHFLILSHDHVNNLFPNSARGGLCLNRTETLCAKTGVWGGNAKTLKGSSGRTPRAVTKHWRVPSLDKNSERFLIWRWHDDLNCFAQWPFVMAWLHIWGNGKRKESSCWSPYIPPNFLWT